VTKRCKKIINNETRDRILSAAMQVANLKGYKNVTRNDVAVKADAAVGLVNYYFGEMRKLQTEMVKRAIETENLKIVGQALANRHPLAVKAPEALRIRAARVLAE
jgi:AcrR family transcriptional regulator